jgi:beta-lactamase superfamily II metal-dependent hydrolase
MPKGKIRKRTEKKDPFFKAPTPSVLKRVTRSQTKEERDKQRQLLLDQLEIEAAALKKKRDDALANQPKAPAGQCGDGRLHIAFVQMGQGDCTLISTPKGRFIMIDCGSDATEEYDSKAYDKRISDTIQGKKFMGGTKDVKQLDVLILTHADTDHYNKLVNVLRDDTVIHSIYHSGEIQHYAGGVSGWLRGHVNTNFIYAVTLKADRQVVKDPNSPRTVAKQINGKAPANLDVEKKILGLDNRGVLRIVHEENCQISLLASNHSQNTEDDKSQGDRNRGSVVTLIEAFGKKILICGDATKSTEKFLLDEYGDLLANLDLMQAPHHGSNVTSSSDSLVNKLKPKKAIISAGKEVYKDHLPSQVVIKKYLDQQADKQVPSHEVFYWVEGGYHGFIKGSQFIERYLYITGSNMTIERVFPE